MVARKVIVDHRICDDDGRNIDPKFKFEEIGVSQLPPGLAGVRKPKIGRNQNEWNAAIYRVAQRIFKKDDDPDKLFRSVVHRLLTSPSAKETAAIQREVEKLKGSRHVANVATPSAARVAARPAAAPVAVKQAARPTQVPLRQPQPVARLPRKPAPMPASRIRVNGVVIDDFLAEEVNVPSQLPKKSASKPIASKASARPAAPVAAKSSQQSSLAKLKAVVKARPPATRVDMAESLDIPTLTATGSAVSGTLTIQPEGATEVAELRYSWLIATPEAILIVQDTRVISEVGADETWLSEFDRLFLNFAEEETGETYETTSIATVYQYKWGVFQFIQFLLAD